MRMTQKRAEIVQALQCNPTKFLMVRPISAVPMPRRKELLTGTKLVDLVDGKAVECPEAPALSGVAVTGLVDAGYLVVSPAPLQWGRLYVLSERGQALSMGGVAYDRHPKTWDAELGPRIFRQGVDEIAAQFGASIEFNNTRKWWELSITKEGSKIKERLLLTNQNGEPIARLNDLSLVQWREVITRNALINNLSAAPTLAAKP